MKKKRRPGRPSLGGNGHRTTRMHLRIAPGDLKRLEAAAKASGKTLSAWVRDALLASADAVSGKH